MSDVRRTEILTKTQQWKSIPFEQLRKGDTFRMFEPTGEPVLDKSKNNIFIAHSDPYLTKEGVYGISIK